MSDFEFSVRNEKKQTCKHLEVILSNVKRYYVYASWLLLMVSEQMYASTLRYAPYTQQSVLKI